MLKYMDILFIYKAADYRICFENNISMEAYFMLKILMIIFIQVLYKYYHSVVNLNN